MLDKLTRNARIDLLRGIAILLVLLLHFHLSYRLDQIALLAWVPESILQMLLRNGNYGVTMFFVISGFLITRTTQQHWDRLGQVDVLGFYANRFARIIPPLLLALIVIIVLGCADLPSFMNSDAGNGFPNAFFFIAGVSVLTFWHNVLMQHVGYFNYALNIYWSLSVEEIFYLFFPLLCLLLSRQRLILLACCLLIITGPIYRSIHADNELYFMYGYWACFDAIALGVATALIAPRVPQLGWYVMPLQYGAVLLITFTFWQGIIGHEIFGFSLIALGTAVLLLFAGSDVEKGRTFTSLSARSLRLMGRYSYELYLFHIVLLGLLRTLIPPESMGSPMKLVWLFIYLITSVLLAKVIAYYFSEPVNTKIRAAFAELRLKKSMPDFRLPDTE